MEALAVLAPRLRDFSRASFSNACLELLLQVLHELGQAEVYPTGKKEQDKPKPEKPKDPPFVVNADFRQRLIEVTMQQLMSQSPHYPLTGTRVQRTRRRTGAAAHRKQF